MARHEQFGQQPVQANSDLEGEALRRSRAGLIFPASGARHDASAPCG